MYLKIFLTLILIGGYIGTFGVAWRAPIPLQQATPKPGAQAEPPQDSLAVTEVSDKASAPTSPSVSPSTTPSVLPVCEAGASRIVLSDSEDEEELVKIGEDEVDNDLLFQEPLSGVETREVLKRALEMMNPAVAKRPRTGQYDEMARLFCTIAIHSDLDQTSCID